MLMYSMNTKATVRMTYVMMNSTRFRRGPTFCTSRSMPMWRFDRYAQLIPSITAHVQAIPLTSWDQGRELRRT